MKLLLRLVFFFLLGWGNLYAQSNLPPCPSSGHFHNCLGTFTFTSGNKYVGEWRENAPRGNGVMYFSNGDIYSGKFGVQASGTYTFSDGRPSIEAYWSYDNTVRKKVLNSLIGEAIIGSLIKAIPPVTQIISGNSNDRVNSEIEAESKKRQEFEQQEKARINSESEAQKANVVIKNVPPENERLSLEASKKKCTDLGFKPATEGHGKCVLQLSK